MADKLEAKISLVDYDEQTETSSYKIHISCDQNEIWTVLSHKREISFGLMILTVYFITG
jgi:hypothetical protein